MCRDWEFVSKGTEISLGKFVSEYFTQLTLTLDSPTGVVSTEDTDEIWKEAKEEAMEKVKGRANRQVREDSPMVDETEVEKSFCLSRSDDWVINRKTKKIVLLEFKRTSDCGESYYVERNGQVAHPYPYRSQGPGRRVRMGGRSCPDGLRIFGIGKEDGQRTIGRLGRTLLDEHEKLFGSYWRHTFGPSSSLLQLLGKGISVRTSRPSQGGYSGGVSR